MEKDTALYEVRHYDKDGNFGAYCGTGKGAKEAFKAEISYCERAGYKYIATIRKGM